jgi:hypothetical protein
MSVVEMADGSLVATQYGERLTRVLPVGKTQELGESFDWRGLGIVADGPDAVLAIDNGAGVVRRVSFGGRREWS